MNSNKVLLWILAFLFVISLAVTAITNLAVLPPLKR